MKRLWRWLRNLDLVDTLRNQRNDLEDQVCMLTQQRDELTVQLDSLQHQVNHAAKATNELAHLCRASEVAAAWANLEARGINVFPGRKAGMELPSVSSETQQILDSQPKQLT